MIFVLKITMELNLKTSNLKLIINYHIKNGFQDMIKFINVNRNYQKEFQK